MKKIFLYIQGINFNIFEKIKLRCDMNKKNFLIVLVAIVVMVFIGYIFFSLNYHFYRYIKQKYCECYFKIFFR